MVHNNSPTVEFWQEKIEVNLRRANTEPSVDFRRANTEPSVDFRKANTEPRLFLGISLGAALPARGKPGLPDSFSQI